MAVLRASAGTGTTPLRAEPERAPSRPRRHVYDELIDEGFHQRYAGIQFPALRLLKSGRCEGRPDPPVAGTVRWEVLCSARRPGGCLVGDRIPQRPRAEGAW